MASSPELPRPKTWDYESVGAPPNFFTPKTESDELSNWKSLPTSEIKRKSSIGVGNIEVFGTLISMPLQVLEIKLYDNLITKLESKFFELYNEIEISKYLLELEDDWDDEGSKGYNKETWIKAVKFITNHTKAIHRITNQIIATPKISHGPYGAIDLHWNLERYRLLIKIPEDTNVATFYGDDREKTEVKGEINIKGDKKDGLFLAMLHFT